MAQLSRPYQIGLVAVALLAAAWLLLLQGHSSSSSPGSPSAVSSSPSPGSASSGSAGARSTPHPGSTSGPTAPGVRGLTRAIQKAQGAVKTSEQSAKNLQRNSEAASSPTGTSVQPGAASSSGVSTSKHPSSSSSSSSSAAKTTKAAAPSSASKPAVRPAPAKPAPASHAADQRQLSVEAQLHKGKIVLILFWDAKGTDDRLVHRAVQQVARSGRDVAVETATPQEVAAFGSITRGVGVYGTPTLLVVNAKGKAIALSGLQDPYGIAQAIAEARHA